MKQQQGQPTAVGFGDTPFIYDAFISYKHGDDKPVAAGLQLVLQTLGKAWWQRRSMRVFRDATALAPSAALALSIENALQQSRALVLIASPEAGASPWVEKEVAYWLEHRDLSKLFIAVTAGDLRWDARNNDFVWDAATPLPPSLKGRFAHEPLWVDLRHFRGSKAHIGKHDQDFVDCVGGIAAAILGRAKDDLLSEELRQQRRNLTFAWGAAAGLADLAITAGFLAVEAERQRGVAVKQEQQAHRNNARAQMQLALVYSERAATSEALAAAFEAVDAAKTADVDIASLERDLYAVSSKVPRGLVSAVTIAWPSARAGHDVRDMHFLPNAAGLCTVSTSNNLSGRDDLTHEDCFGIEDRKLALRPDLRLGSARVDTAALGLDISYEKESLLLTLLDDEGNVGKPFKAISAKPFGDYLATSGLSGGVCRDLKRGVISVFRSKPDRAGSIDNATQFIGNDTFLITFETGAVKRINGEFGIDSLACSPDGRYIAGAPDRGDLAILDIDQDFTIVTSNGDLARSAGNAPGVAFSKEGVAIMPGMLQVGGTTTPVAVSLL